MTIGAWLKPQHQILCLVTIYTFLYSSFLSFTNTTFWICCDFYIINYLCILHSILCCVTFHLFSCRYHLFLQYLNSDILKIFYIWFTCQVIPLYLSAFMLGVILVPIMTETQILAEITEILPVEQGCIVAACACKYAQWSKGLVELGDNCSGTGRADELYLHPSELLAHSDQQVLSCASWYPEGYSHIFPWFPGKCAMSKSFCSCDRVTIWQGWQCWMCAATILSNPGNHTWVHTVGTPWSLWYLDVPHVWA